MNDDAKDLTSALSPLAREGAPPGFAARLQERYRTELAARRRRTALGVSMGCFAALAAMVVFSGLPVPQAPAPTLASAIAALATTLSVLTRAALLPALDDPARTAETLVAMAVLAAAASVALAALVRREALLSGRAQ